MSETITLCKSALHGSWDCLIEFFGDYGHLVERLTKDGVLFKRGEHYIFSTNSECPGCVDCKGSVL